MLYHTCICVPDVEKSAKFYDEALAVLGYRRVYDFTPDAIGYGKEHDEFWIQTPENQGRAEPSRSLHFAFAARTREDVDRFYEIAMAFGGVSNLGPGHYPQYHPQYYGAVVTDRDDNKIEILVYPRTEA